jgi:Na+/H+-dicarboxylate symporter
MSSTETQEKSITSNLTSQILIAMVLGAILGVVIHNTISAEAAYLLVIRLKFCNSLY